MPTCPENIKDPTANIQLDNEYTVKPAAEAEADAGQWKYAVTACHCVLSLRRAASELHVL